MAALRKKYQGRGLEDDGKTAPSVSVPPSAGAQLPPIDDSPRPADLAPETDAAEEAAQSAIKQRLAELEQAEALTQPEPPQFATEPQPQQPSPLEQALAAAPEAARGWLRSHSEYLTDPEQNAHLQSAHWVARGETGEEYTPRYFRAVEVHLGLRDETPPQRSTRPAAPRQHRGPAVSAPPTRDSPSMSTGRPMRDGLRLNSEELQLAATLGITPDEYRQGKERMLREKGAGFHDDRR